MKVLEVVEEITACDRCPARAIHLYISPLSGLTLAFCGHHSSKHGPALDELGWPLVEIKGEK